MGEDDPVYGKRPDTPEEQALYIKYLENAVQAVQAAPEAANEVHKALWRQMGELHQDLRDLRTRVKVLEDGLPKATFNRVSDVDSNGGHARDLVTKIEGDLADKIRHHYMVPNDTPVLLIEHGVDNDDYTCTWDYEVTLRLGECDWPLFRDGYVDEAPTDRMLRHDYRFYGAPEFLRFVEGLE